MTVEQLGTLTNLTFINLNTLYSATPNLVADLEDLFAFSLGADSNLVIDAYKLTQNNSSVTTSVTLTLGQDLDSDQELDDNEIITTRFLSENTTKQEVLNFDLPAGDYLVKLAVAEASDAFELSYFTNFTATTIPEEWIEQIGTSSSDISNGVATDSNGNIYISGYTQGNLGGTNEGKSDAWVAKISQPTTNKAPYLVNAIADQSTNANEFYSLTLPTYTFLDLEDGTNLSYSATLTNGGSLPNWLNFNGDTRTLSGTPTQEEVLEITVTATDSAGAIGEDSFDLTIKPRLINHVLGTKNPDLLSGTFKDDIMLGFGENDTLYGYDGNDTLNGGSGLDILTGGAGSDRFKLLSASTANRDIILDFEDGVDFLELTGDLSFGSLTITQAGDDTQIIETATSQTLAVLVNTNALTINNSDFNSNFV